jgi:replicative DNA helicase
MTDHDHEHVLASGLLQRPARFSEIDQIGSEFFGLKETRSIFSLAEKYWRKHSGKIGFDIPLALRALETSSSKAAPALLGLVEEYSTYASVSDNEFRASVVKLVSIRKRKLIKKHGANALEAALGGDWDQAENELRRGALGIDDVLDDSVRDVRSKREADEAKADLDVIDGQVGGFDVGFGWITDRVSLRKKELTIVGGYSADGKTQLSKTFAYNVHIRNSANVLFTALEMTAHEMRVLLVAQHAATIDPAGVDYRSILDRCPGEHDRKLYLRALDDFQFTEHEDVLEGESSRGKLMVWAPHKAPTMSRYLARCRALNDDLPGGLDVAFADYLELIKPDRDHGQYRLNIKAMAEQVKEASRDLDAWMVLTHQISRSGRDAAEKRQPPHYIKRDLGESSGIERAADSIMWIYTDDYLKSENESKVGIAKARKGVTLVHGRHVYANFAKTIVAELTQ